MKTLAIMLLACASAANAATGTLTGSLPKANDAAITVKAARFDSEPCTLTPEPKGKGFVLKAKTKSGALLPASCELGFKITPPAAPRVSPGSGLSDILLDGVQETPGAGAGLIDIGDKWSR